MFSRESNGIDCDDRKSCGKEKASADVKWRSIDTGWRGEEKHCAALIRHEAQRPSTAKQCGVTEKAKDRVATE